ncbi:MAG: DNA topoisomerase VI subunit B, partial [Candidatus Krumholzibacteria bacterium]|nr:DNA topoisomerase VI subunit B [Candidatus Krumholzibacteria bacterium]
MASSTKKRKSPKGGRSKKNPRPRSKTSGRKSTKVSKGESPLPLFEAADTSARETTIPQKAKSDKSSSPQKRERSYQTAHTIGLKQREISISEFFAKNRHLLGFDSLPKALLTAVKEAVDNSLDACEEAGILPDILVELSEKGENRYRLIVEDSGPGIVKSQVPRIFGKLLYGSKFHVLKQSRGQQGIGISAAVMYSQLTTGKSVRVISRTGARQQAHVYELQIDTKKNNPVILSDKTAAWGRPHGTHIEMEILASYKKGQRSVDAYLHQVAMANPHAQIVYRPPKGDEIVYKRLSHKLPDEPKEIRPHPHGVELGVLLDMLKVTKSRNIKGFLETEFSRMSSRTSSEVLELAGITPRTSPKRITRDQGEAIVKAFVRARIMKPPTNCLSPIGEDLVTKSLGREADADFCTSLTRPPAVYRGNPFQIEVGIAYGGTSGDEEETVRLHRFANRAPLIYQQSACAITQSVIGTAWRSYGVTQARGALPTGPLIIVVHIASAWVPFTSESKEAIAHYSEIIKEIKLALQECGRR